MRYSPEHKKESRDRIVAAARTLFRRDGLDAPSIDQVMAEAGLTRGAFYAHFPSREALVEEVLHIDAGLVRELGKANEADDSGAAANRAIRKYLDPRHRDDNATGCPLVAHPNDAIRGSENRRAAYEQQFRAMAERLGRATSDDPDADDALVASVLTVGAAIISAAVSDDALADRIESLSMTEVERILS